MGKIISIDFLRDKILGEEVEYLVAFDSGNIVMPRCNATDYGFGPIVPCIIFHGEKEVAKIDYRNHTEYQLKSDAFGLDIALTKGYKNLEVYDEATIIITDALKEKSHEWTNARVLSA